MKKKYYRPEIEELEIYTSTMLALSLFEDDEENNRRGHSSDQKSDEYRGDWNNIWEGM